MPTSAEVFFRKLRRSMVALLWLLLGKLMVGPARAQAHRSFERDLRQRSLSWLAMVGLRPHGGLVSPSKSLVEFNVTLASICRLSPLSISDRAEKSDLRTCRRGPLLTGDASQLQ